MENKTGNIVLNTIIIELIITTETTSNKSEPDNYYPQPQIKHFLPASYNNVSALNIRIKLHKLISNYNVGLPNLKDYYNYIIAFNRVLYVN